MAQYDVIVLDETQDFNPCQYDAFVYQEPRCVRYLLGDEFQRVYGFRGAREDFEACHVLLWRLFAADCMACIACMISKT